MKRITDNPAARQWLWFVGLWLAGLGAALALGQAVKLLVSLAG